jgi:hypothetical protein
VTRKLRPLSNEEAFTYGMSSLAGELLVSERYHGIDTCSTECGDYCSQCRC